MPVTVIGSTAFSGCSSLTEIILPDTIQTIEAMAFANTNVTKLHIPASVTTIGNDAFYWCTMLTKLVLPDSITTIHSNAVNSKTSIRGTLYEGGNYIGPPSNPYMMLIDVLATSVTELKLHPDTKIIGSYSCQSLPNLQSVVIPANVESVGIYAFSGCDNLVSIAVDEHNPTLHSDGNCVINTAEKNSLLGVRPA